MDERTRELREELLAEERIEDEAARRVSNWVFPGVQWPPGTEIGHIGPREGQGEQDVDEQRMGESPQDDLVRTQEGQSETQLVFEAATAADRMVVGRISDGLETGRALAHVIARRGIETARMVSVGLDTEGKLLLGFHPIHTAVMGRLGIRLGRTSSAVPGARYPELVHCQGGRPRFVDRDVDSRVIAAGTGADGEERNPGERELAGNRVVYPYGSLIMGLVKIPAPTQDVFYNGVKVVDVTQWGAQEFGWGVEWALWRDGPGRFSGFWMRSGERARTPYVRFQRPSWVDHWAVTDYEVWAIPQEPQVGSTLATVLADSVKSRVGQKLYALRTEYGNPTQLMEAAMDMFRATAQGVNPQTWARRRREAGQTGNGGQEETGVDRAE